ncbi:MAG: hypothetical protein O2798_11375, partial [Chloroflexi bacterium]|nr:hypothetical protein [Chloroflexota bacterium]
MALDAPAIAWLRTAEGARATAEATTALQAGTGLLSVIEALRRVHEADHARWAVTLAEGRVAARGKFEDAGALYLDREAAEQAT